MYSIVKTCKKHDDLIKDDCYIKNTFLRCRLCQREWSKNNYEKNKEKIIKRHIKYTIQYRKNNPDKVKKYNATYWKNGFNEVNPNYVKDSLKRKSRLKNSEIPQILVKIQTQVIKIKRKIKEMKETPYQKVRGKKKGKICTILI